MSVETPRSLPTSAADDLGRTRYQDTADGKHRWMRLPNAAQEWVIMASGGRVLKVGLDNNFSKKHLFTFSLNDVKFAVALSKATGAIPGLAKDQEAEYILVQEKIRKVSKHRVDDLNRCAICNHTYKNHPPENNLTHCRAMEEISTKPIKWKQVDCACTMHVSQYAKERNQKGKGLLNPVRGSGSKTSFNTVIIMNEIERDHFRAVVCKAVEKAEKDNIWNINKKGRWDVTIKLEFDKTKPGPVRDIQYDKIKDTVTGFDTRYHNVEVTLEKELNQPTDNYKIVHLVKAF